MWWRRLLVCAKSHHIDTASFSLYCNVCERVAINDGRSTVANGQPGVSLRRVNGQALTCDMLAVDLDEATGAGDRGCLLKYLPHIIMQRRSGAQMAHAQR